MGIDLQTMLRQIMNQDNNETFDRTIHSLEVIGGALQNLLNAVMVMEFWSDPQEEVAVPAVAADLALPDVVVNGLPSSGIQLVVAMFKWRAIENTNVGANKLNGPQTIQVRSDAPGAWTDGINLVDDQFGLAATTREGADIIIGNLDLSGEVVGDGTYNFQWAQALADLADINFNDIQVGLRVYVTV